jgi:hypothetical protein
MTCPVFAGDSGSLREGVGVGPDIQVPECHGEQGEPQRGELQDPEGAAWATRQWHELLRAEVRASRLRDTERVQPTRVSLRTGIGCTVSMHRRYTAEIMSHYSQIEHGDFLWRITVKFLIWHSTVFVLIFSITFQ